MSSSPYDSSSRSSDSNRSSISSCPASSPPAYAPYLIPTFPFSPPPSPKSQLRIPKPILSSSSTLSSSSFTHQPFQVRFSLPSSSVNASCFCSSAGRVPPYAPHRSSSLHSIPESPSLAYTAFASRTDGGGGGGGGRPGTSGKEAASPAPFGAAAGAAAGPGGKPRMSRLRARKSM
jgi:hypothetical protein